MREEIRGEIEGGVKKAQQGRKKDNDRILQLEGTKPSGRRKQGRKRTDNKEVTV